LHPFKKGAFMMALDAGVPVVPVSISGATRIMPKAQMRIYPETVRITLHEPIPTAGLSKEDLGELMKIARDKIASALTPEEGPAPDGQLRRRAN
jgi:1-acyl-sn-glycerol-3-phosphate acyltransferase